MGFEYKIRPREVGTLPGVEAAEQVVEVWHDGEMLGCFYAHAVKGRRFVVFISKHLTGARMDTRDLAAPGCIMALQ